MRAWLERKNMFYSRLAEEDCTNEEVVWVHIGCVVFILMLGIL